MQYQRIGVCKFWNGSFDIINDFVSVNEDGNTEIIWWLKMVDLSLDMVRESMVAIVFVCIVKQRIQMKNVLYRTKEFIESQRKIYNYLIENITN